MAIAKVGDVFTTNSGHVAEIVEYLDTYNVKIKFSDPIESFRWCRIGDLRKGKVANVFARSVYGVGYIGEGAYKLNSNNDPVCSSTWHHMIERCYHLEIQKNKYPTYIGCSVEEKWHNFQNFADFYYKDPWRQEGWCLDKDIISPGNKVYSAENCAFLPREINNLLCSSKARRGEWLIGVSKVSERVNKSKPFFARVVDIGKEYCSYFATELEAFYFYKENKERIIQDRVKKYDRLVDPRVLESLSKWRVNIDD